MPDVLKAHPKQLDEDGVELHSISAGSKNDEPELIDSEWCEAENEIIYNDVKGDEVDRGSSAVMRKRVFIKVPLEQGLKAQGSLHEVTWINSKSWVNVRCRLVVQEIKARNTGSSGRWAPLIRREFLGLQLELVPAAVWVRFYSCG